MMWITTFKIADYRITTTVVIHNQRISSYSHQNEATNKNLFKAQVNRTQVPAFPSGEKRAPLIKPSLYENSICKISTSNR